MQSVKAKTYLSTSLTLPSSNISIHYRTAGSPENPTLLLLHGFPSSSHQFRNIISPLSAHYRVIAPDFPGYGFTTVPDNYTYNFASLASTIADFLAQLNISRYAIYIFDYGAPVGIRLALKDPSAITAIISQNGNAYEEGFGADFWAPVREYWRTHSPEVREKIRSAVLNVAATKWQYTNNNPHAEQVQPEAWTLDQALLDRPGNNDIQLDLLYDYRTNVDLYPDFHRFLREKDVPVLAMWGKGDVIFVPAGAEAFKQDVKPERLTLEFVDSGHFAIETNEQIYVDAILKFLGKWVK